MAKFYSSNHSWAAPLLDVDANSSCSHQDDNHPNDIQDDSLDFFLEARDHHQTITGTTLIRMVFRGRLLEDRPSTRAGVTWAPAPVLLAFCLPLEGGFPVLVTII